jgi:thioredoxin-related protein
VDNHKYLILLINFNNTLRRLLPALVLAAALPASAATTRDAMTHFFEANTGDLRAELADAKAAGKKAVLLMYEQEGCPACLAMKQNVLNRVDVQELYRKHFVSFTVDIHGAVPLKDFSGRDITEKSFAATAGVRATPTFAFHDHKGTEVVRITGAVRDVREFRLLAEFVASGAYGKHSFTDYKRLHLNKKGR